MYPMQCGVINQLFRSPSLIFNDLNQAVQIIIKKRHPNGLETVVKNVITPPRDHVRGPADPDIVISVNTIQGQHLCNIVPKPGAHFISKVCAIPR